MKLNIFVCLCLCLTIGNAFKILSIVAVGNKSIHYLFLALSKILTDNGHNVTFVSKFPVPHEYENLNHIKITDLNKTTREKDLFFKSSSEIFKYFEEVVEEIAIKMWTDPEIQRLLETKNEYDAIIIPSSLNEITFPLLQDYPGSIILFSDSSVEYFSISYMGNWLSPAVTPNMIIHYDEYMTFFERTVNLVSLITTKIYLHHITYPKFQKIIERFFPDIGDVLR